MSNLSKLTFLILFFLTTSLLAQSNYSYKYDWDDWDNYGLEFEFDRPFIEVNYGFGTPMHDEFNAEFARVGMLELKLGYLKESDLIYYEIDDREEGFVFGSLLSSDMKSEDPSAAEFESKLWRFGFATRNTLGYYGDDFSVLPYNEEGFVWSRFETSETVGPVPFIGQIDEKVLNDFKIVDRYQDTFRFGTLAEGGIRLEFANLVSINAGYEASVIFPRHLFWKHAGSYLIQKAGQGALKFFIDEITDSSPVAGPIVNFILQNGYSYAFYSLMKKDMNWPFSTEMPLTYETFKLGVTFTF